MDSDPSQIPVLPIPFEHGLNHFAQSLIVSHGRLATMLGDGCICNNRF